MPTRSSSDRTRTTCSTPGIAFPLVRKLLALNDGAPAEAPRVEVILLSRNSADTRPAHLQLDRAPRAGDQARGVHATARRRFPTSARSAPTCSCRPMPKTCAARWPPASPPRRSCRRSAPQQRHDQLRIAFDGDAVIFGDEGERVSREGGLAAFHRARAQRMPASRCPAARSAASSMRCTGCRRRSRRTDAPIRTALVTARSAPAHERVILHAARVGHPPGRGAVPRRPRQGTVPGSLRRRHLLRRFRAQHRSARDHVAAGHVPHGIANR